MRHWKAWLLAGLLLPLTGNASHIVGGEFELIHLTGFQYRLNLILYFDKINGAPGALDPSASVRIFRMRDNAIMMDVFMPLVSETGVSYTQPECSHGELVTSKLLYTADIFLSGATFNDPAGYYVAWERCCRNYNISNIFSEIPPASNFAGQTFYLEFPPVMKDGVPFVDSTPRLFPPLNDFACPNRPYYTDFGGTDDDGDSLVYSLAVPLNTKSSDALPPTGTRPRPYPPVNYRAPYSATNILNGHPDLKISRDGFLTVTPSNQGLFVFAVKVEEYRNGFKIGETRRDFQMLVVDACPVAQPPNIVGRDSRGVSFSDEVLDVFFDSSVADEDRCVVVRVSDPDALSQDDNFQERVKIKAIAMNFKKDLTAILPAEISAVLDHGSTVDFRICLPECPFMFGGAAQIGIVAMDDACSLPLTDTLKINVLVEGPPNQKPRFTTPNPVSSVLNEGSQGAWPYAVLDDDGDTIVVSVLTDGFVLANAGMTFNNLHQEVAASNGEVKWDAYCDIYNFTQRTNFQVTVQVEDRDKCKIPNPAKAIYNLRVILPGNADPVIDTDLTPAASERDVGLTRRVNESLNFTVRGTDLTDNDLLVLSGSGDGFTFSDFGMTATPLPVTANGSTQATLGWEIQCNSINLDARDSLNFRFIVVDNANKCRFYKADTVDVHVKVLPPLNEKPMLTFTNLNPAQTTFVSNATTLTRGPEIKFSLTGTDADVTPSKDHLVLELIGQQGNVEPRGFAFENVAGTSPVQGVFTWLPDCSVFENGVYENNYVFTFRLSDDHCITAKADTVSVAITLKDIDSEGKDFIPPNFFSPNGDNINDYYALESIDPDTGERVSVLPPDNCDSQFEGVFIYNRWGKEVFSSTDRDFKWLGTNESPGVYYYSIKFSKKEYRGTVTLRY